MPDTASSPREVYVTCRSASARSHAAEQLARALAGLREGAVETVDQVEGEGEGAVAVVALDGCSSACGARLLEAHGITPRAAFTLDDVGTDLSPEAADDLLHRAETLVERGGQAHRPRRRAPHAAAAAPRVHSLEDYLIAVDMLTSPVGPCGALVENAPTLAAHVSSALGVSRPTAGEMLNRMEAEGLIQRGESKELILGPRGRAAADDVLRGHRLLERFVVDTLGYEAAGCFEQARQLAPSFGPEDVRRLTVALGHPERCPHGWPIEPEAARRLALELVSLASLGEGETATVEVVPEWDGAALAELAAVAIAPGSLVSHAGGAHDALVVRTGDGERRLTRASAEAVLVRRP